MSPGRICSDRSQFGVRAMGLVRDRWGSFVNRHAPSHADLLVPPTSSHGAVEFVSGPDLVAMQGCVRAVHRDRRDGHACHQKYGKDWDRYCTIVKYRIVPLVY